MKRLIAVFVLMAAFTFVAPVHADTVQTCSNVYGGGQVCGESTANPVVNTAVPTDELVSAALLVVGVAIAATVLYKISYRWYILG